MARRKSLAKQIMELQPADSGRLLWPVEGEPGLYVRVSPAGAKTFTIVARKPVSKKQIWAAVPTLVDMDNLTDEDVDRVRAEAREGISRIRKGESEAFPPPPAEPDSFKTVAQNWLKRHVSKNNHLTEAKTKRTLERLVYPVLGKRPITEIRRSEIVELLDKIEDDNGPVMADRTLEHLRSIFSWHETRDDDFVTPIRRGMARTKPDERRDTRVLSDQEIRLLWPLCDGLGAYGGMVQIALLTGARLEKLQQMRWEDIDSDGVWTIPEKSRREKVNAQKLPLPPLAVQVIQAQDRLVGNPYVFASPKTGHYINGLSKSKRQLDAKLLEALKKEAEEAGQDADKVELKPWKFHRLRHTAKTLLARAGVPDFDSERTLGHAIKGIGKKYDHHDYTPQRGAALAALAALIQTIIDPPPADDGKVVKMQRAG